MIVFTTGFHCLQVHKNQLMQVYVDILLYMSSDQSVCNHHSKVLDFIGCLHSVLCFLSLFGIVEFDKEASSVFKCAVIWCGDSSPGSICVV